MAAHDANRRREIASIAGRAAQMKGTAHRFSSQEGRDASIKGHAQRRLLRRADLAEPPMTPDEFQALQLLLPH